MRTHHHLTIPTLTAALLLSLIACSSSDNNDPTKSADSTPSSKLTFHFPDDFKVKIEENKTGDPTKDEILKDHRYAILAKNEGLTKGHPGKNFDRYWKKGANIEFRRIFNSYHKKKLTVSGVDRFYNRRVVNRTPKLSTVVMCEDQTKAFDKERKTGEVRRDKPSLDSYRKIRAKLAKESSGRWKITYYYTLIGDKLCKETA